MAVFSSKLRCEERMFRWLRKPPEQAAACSSQQVTPPAQGMLAALGKSNWVGPCESFSSQGFVTHSIRNLLLTEATVRIFNFAVSVATGYIVTRNC